MEQFPPPYLPENHGWPLKTGIYQLKWFEGPQAPWDLADANENNSYSYTSVGLSDSSTDSE